MNNEKVAIILAAGLGSRLMPLIKKIHKCMTKVNGIPIVYNALKKLKEKNFENVVIVVGYLREELKKQILDFGLNLNIVFAENEVYDQTNTVFSLKKGLEKLTAYEELFIIEGDVFFEAQVLDRLLHSMAKNATVLEPYNELLEGTFVELNDKHYVIDWRHKSDQPEGYCSTDKYKTVNLHKFSKKFVDDYLMPVLEKMLDNDGMKKPLEKVMREIVIWHPDLIQGEVLSGEKWYEIDEVNDLRIAEQLFGGK